MKIRTGLLFLMAGAFVGLSTASSHAVPSLLDGAQSAQVDASGGNVVTTGEEWSPSTQTAITDVRLHSSDSSGAFLVAGATTQSEAESLLETSAADGTTVFFDHQFNKGIPPRWKPKNGEWAIAKNKAGEDDFLASPGVSDISSSIVFSENFSDFVFTVRMMRRSSDKKRASRIIVRARGPLMESGHFENEYIFNITRKGTFSVFKFVDGNQIRLEDWTQSDAIRTGNRFNELRVTAKGEELTFSINGVQVWKDTDSSLETGKVGVGFYNHPDSTDNELLVDWAILEIFVSASSQAAATATETSIDSSGDDLPPGEGTADESP